jgi:phenylpyruvate tautomerase PptA (4-oxalocrotonate tautomerase family)
MTTIKLKVDPDQTPEEEAELVARVAAAVAETTGDDTVRFELEKTEHMQVAGNVAERMSKGMRWSA